MMSLTRKNNKYKKLNLGIRSLTALLFFVIMAGCSKEEINLDTELTPEPVVQGKEFSKEITFTLSGNNFGNDINKLKVIDNDNIHIISVCNTLITATAPGNFSPATIKIMGPDGQTHTFDTPIWNVTTVIGNGNGTIIDDIPTHLHSNIVIDSKKNLYFFDESGIRKVNPCGELSVLIKKQNLSPDSHIVKSVKGLALIESSKMVAHKYLLLTDFYNHRILKVNLKTKAVSVFAGRAARGHRDGELRRARFNYPKGIVTDKQGNIYVSDSDSEQDPVKLGGKIRKISPDGIVSTLAGGNTNGHQDGFGTNALFYSPYKMVVDNSGNLYVADQHGDYGISSSSLRKIRPDGLVSTIWFRRVNAMAVDDSDNLYIDGDDYYDYSHMKIRKINLTTGVETTFAGTTWGHRDGPISSAKFTGVKDIAIDASGNFFIDNSWDGGVIRKITPPPFW